MESLNLGRLLIVDDESELAAAICEILKTQGYETEGFTAGEKALERLKKEEFDLLLTDLMMPEMDGIALLEAALEIDPDLIGIIMTGQGTVQTAVEAMKKGAFDYILKPFKVNTLLPIISRAIAVRNLKKENIELRATLAIYELTKVITLTTDLTIIANKVAEAAMEQTQADEVSVMLPIPNEHENGLYVAAVRGPDRDHLLGQRIKVGQGIAGWTAQHHQPIQLEGEVKDPRFEPVYPRSDIKTAVSLPMMSGGKFVGVLNLNAVGHRSFTIGQMKALTITISMAAPSIENARLFEMLQEAEAKYRNIFENAMEGIFQINSAGRFITANPSTALLLGYHSPEDLMKSITDMPGQVFLDRHRHGALMKAINQTDRIVGFETQVNRKDGRSIWISMNLQTVRDSEGRLSYYEGSFKDISLQKQAEESLKKSEEKYRNIFNNAIEGIFQSTPEGRFISVNPATAQIHGFDSPEEMLEVITDSGQQLFVNPEDRTEYKKRLEEQGKVEGFEVEMFKKDGGKIWMSFNAHVVKDNEGKVLYYEGITEDISRRKEAEISLKRSLEQLQKATQGIIQAVVLAVEMRDPYTSGHQKRVADLAHSMAVELGLPPEEIEAIRMASVVHDLGKISIPAEILSKPAKLSDIEFSLIKNHPESGYNILKDIEFPYPVAQIVLQHHERLNGSGYPLALIDDQILTEAKIIAVADVVEAISSHRPYRPAHGIEAALEEIEKNKGVLYDPAAVEVCLRLFKEKGFKFE
ncbi:MAG: HD domain-containing phosphohydrolase [Pseudomonadota bacterium]